MTVLRYSTNPPCCYDAELYCAATKQDTTVLQRQRSLVCCRNGGCSNSAETMSNQYAAMMQYVIVLH